MPGPLASGVTIGGVTLYDFEVPDTIPWGTVQNIKEFIYPGGQNLLQAMGPSREAITWSGQMITPNATDRARLLDQMASAGGPVSLLWGDLCFNGLLKRFRATYKHQWQGQYSIEFLPIWDYQQTAAPADPQGAAGIDMGAALGGLQNTLAAVQGAISTGEGYIQQVQGVINSVGFAVASAQSTVGAIGSLAQGIAGPGALNGVQASLQGALASIGGAAAVAGGVLTGVAAVPQSIGEIVNAAGAAAGCATAFAYTARAAINWTQVPGIATPTLATMQVQPDLSFYAGA